MPKSFIGAFGSRPLVTARVISAVRCSWSSATSSSFFASSASILAVSRPRKVEIARWSSRRDLVRYPGNYIVH